MRPFPPVTAGLLAALAALSASLTAQQIGLLQVLGWTHWHHFAYLVVATALLGFGIAGTILTLARAALVRHGAAVVNGLLIATAVSMPLGVRLAQAPALAVDLPVVLLAPTQLWKLVLLCALLVPPFLAGGLVTGLLLAFYADRPGRLYAASLAGAGGGGLLGLLFVATAAPPRLAPLAGAAALAAVLGRWREAVPGERVATVAATAFLILSCLWPGPLTASEFKPLRRTLDLPGARIIADRPGVRGWVQVVAAPALRPAPAVSLEYAGEIPPHPAVFVNGLPAGSLPPAASPWLEYTTDAAAFVGGPRRRVLLLENGPGGWSRLALRSGARAVTVVEPNAALVDLLTAGDPPLAPEWRAPRVRVVRADARAFLAGTPARYDLIRFPDVGAFGGSAGLLSAGEQFLLTREAVRDAWEHLADDGILVVTTWMEFPERNPLRLIATVAEALESAGARPRAHLAAVRGWAAVTLLARRAPWDDAGGAALRAFCASRGFDLLLGPGVRAGERAANHAWQNPAFFAQVDALVDGPREPLYASYPFLLRPASDQRPYFSQFLRVGQLHRLREAFGARAMPFFEIGSAVVALTFVLLAVLAVVCIVLPVARRGWGAPRRPGVLLYFGGLGAGYMAVEIGAMLEAHAWLGSPVVGVAMVITALLLASGAGSFVSERWPAVVATTRRVMVAIIVGIGVAGLVLAAGAAEARTWPAAVRGLMLLLLVALPGFGMGMAFPLGLRRLAVLRPAQVPWAWAVNGCVSVATPAGATLLAMTLGFGAVFAAAAVAYAIAAAAAGRLGGGDALVGNANVSSRRGSG